MYEDDIRGAIAELARLRRIELRPGWWTVAEGPSSTGPVSGPDALAEALALLGWPAPSRFADAPRANEFPVLLHHPGQGWAVAERMEGERRVAVRHAGGRENWLLEEGAAFFDVAIPEPPSERQFDRAFDVFWNATIARKRALVLAVVATVTINFIALGTSIFSMQVYDRVIPRGSFSTLWVLSAGMVVALGFDFLLRVMRARLLEAEAAGIDREVSEFFFSRAIGARLDARPPSIGTMAAQLKGMEQVRSMMSSATVFALADLPFAVLFIVIVAKLGGIIATVMLVSFGASLAIGFLLARLIRENSQKVQVNGNRKNGLLVEALDAAETVKANRGHWFLLSRWNDLITDLHVHELPVKDLQSIAGSIFGAIQQLAYVALIGWGAFEVYENRMTMGALIACSILASRINGPLIGQLPNMVLSWTFTKISLRMLDDIMSLPGDRPRGSELLRPTNLRGAVSLHNVAFCHPGARSGLAINRLEIRAGERIAIIGGIGSGKSTLLRLISGLYHPSEGRVLLDDLDASLIAGEILRGHVGYLPQDYRLINGSLRDNLLLGLPDPGDDAIMAAGQLTGLSQFVGSHPLGIDLPISEGGGGLSGGQRVLAGLTRLMLADPHLWLLDEPTANLDVDTETRVLQALQQKVRPEATLVFVTHKLQLLNLVQRVIVMANGQIVMDGPTQDIIARLSGKTVQRPPAATATVRTVPAAAAV